MEKDIPVHDSLTGDYTLKIHQSGYHLFSVFISKRGFSSLQTKKVVHSVIDYVQLRHIVFIPGKAEIGRLPSEGLTKANTNNYDCCLRGIRTIEGNHGHVAI